MSIFLIKTLYKVYSPHDYPTTLIQKPVINNISFIRASDVEVSTIPDELFCAIRYGDDEGFGESISGLESDNPIELQGVYIDKNHAYPSIGNPGDPVLHFIHHPVGFVIYNGKRYE
nr:hypothetical protein [Bacillus cereus]